MVVVRSSLCDAGVHAWAAEFGSRQGKKRRRKWAGFRSRLGGVGVRIRVMVMEVVMGVGRIRGII